MFKITNSKRFRHWNLEFVSNFDIRISKFSSKNEGYIALMSALIITAVIVIISVTIGQVSFLSRINIADTHFKNKSRALAEACANTALLKFVSSSSYSGNETITVASDTCKIFSIVSSSTGRIIPAQGTFANSFTNYKVTIASNTVSLISWEEVQTLP